MSKSTDSPHIVYETIAHDLAGLYQAEAGKMFGMDVIQIDGKAFAGFYQDCMTFKLTGDSHGQALQLAGSKLFDPSGMQRPMKEWVQVTFAHSGDWHRFAESALEYVRAVPKKKPATKKAAPKKKP